MTSLGLDRKITPFIIKFRNPLKGYFVKWAVWISTCGGIGYFPRFPGTIGSIAGLMLFLPFRALPLFPYLVVLIVLFFLGVWASNVSERFFKRKDASHIVIDEVLAVFLVSYFLPQTWPWLLAGLIVFRIFDIVKPPPIKIFEKLPGGWGVMVDDVIAALYSLGLLHLVRVFIL
ncbi:MAG: phosphatidylglycerophosphatase A [Nitrospirae bacterium]|nr:phosphatidylglycerophosphatase A [Candidatus Manganitrophaceae bacterium]